VEFFVCGMMGRFKNRKEKKYGSIWNIGLYFGVTALAKGITLEKQLKESGSLKEKTESEDK
tara:strand:- start:167 stop:349 length:183 start_codon:yes stop_codon:yes gene_type:complete